MAERYRGSAGGEDILDKEENFPFDHWILIFDEFGVAQVISFAYKLNSIRTLSKCNRKRNYYFFK